MWLRLTWAAAVLAIALAATCLSPGPANADASKLERACAASPSTQTDHVYLLPHQTCSIEGMAVAVDDGDFRSLYGPKVLYNARDYGPGYQEQILKILHGIDERLRDRLVYDHDHDHKLKILLYAHGGRVSHGDAVAGAQNIAPGALADGYAPIFLIWNSDMWESYGERLCCVLDGQKSHRAVVYFAPARLAGDLVAGLGRAPEHWGQQVLRFDDSVLRTSGTPYFLSSGDPTVLAGLFWKGRDGHVLYPALGRTGPKGPDILNGADQPAAVRGPLYRVLFPFRLATTATLASIGAQDWDDMVRRTRLAVQPTLSTIVPAPGAPAAAAAARLGLQPAVEDPCDARTRRDLAGRDPTAAQAAQAAARSPRSSPALDVEPIGGFAVFMDHLACEIGRGFGVAGATADDVELDFYGHSMGAIVGDEIISAHPDLPWRRIVYMGAADSVRDARTYLGPLLACAGTGSRDQCLGADVRFWSLMLHPLAESHDLEGTALLPEGSLLEWVDELFAGPVSVDDRRFGKWTNAEKGLAFFPLKARERMFFRVFPAQDKLRGSTYPEEAALYARQCGAAPDGGNANPPRCHPIVHGDFTNYSFWRDKFLCDVGDVGAGADGPDCASDAPPVVLGWSRGSWRAPT